MILGFQTKFTIRRSEKKKHKWARAFYNFGKMDYTARRYTIYIGSTLCLSLQTTVSSAFQGQVSPLPRSPLHKMANRVL